MLNARRSEEKKREKEREREREKDVEKVQERMCTHPPHTERLISEEDEAEERR